MRVTWVTFIGDVDEGFKALNASIFLAPGVVLFGRNDSGKTNILEGLSLALCGGGMDIRGAQADGDIDDVLGPEVRFALVELELDHLECDESPDACLLTALVLGRPPAFVPGRGSVRVRRGPDQGRPVYLGEHDSIDLSDEPPVWSAIRARLRRELLSRAESKTDAWEEVHNDFAMVLDACLDSNSLALVLDDERSRLFWTWKSGTEMTSKKANAAERLFSSRARFVDDEVPYVGNVLRALVNTPVDKSALGDFLYLGNWPEFRPCSLVHYSYSPASHSTAQGAVEVFLENLARDLMRHAFFRDELLWLCTGWQWEEPWLQSVEDGFVRTSPVIRRMATRLGRLATEIAPDFLRDQYEILVDALGPEQWRGEGGRIAISLAPHDGGRAVPLRLAASGMSVWVGYALGDAMRRVQKQLAISGYRADDAGLDQRVRDFFGDEEWEELRQTPGADELTSDLPSDEPELTSHGDERDSREERVDVPGLVDDRITQSTLFLFDEPEQHLHPTAEADAARWIARLVEEGSTVVLATHSPRFLDLGLPSVEKHLVYRDAARVTVTERLTDDVQGALADAADLAGVSWADLVQLTRAFLIVEGRTDERVISHFYGVELRTRGVTVLPVRGTSKSKSLVEAEFLQRLNVPFLVLFDNTTEANTPERKVIESWLSHWPEDDPRPFVIPFGVPDMFRALPDDLFRRALKARWDMAWPTWHEIESSFSTSNEKSLKSYFLRRLGLHDQETELLEALLLEAPERPLKGSPLDDAMQMVLANVPS